MIFRAVSYKRHLFPPGIGEHQRTQAARSFEIMINCALSNSRAAVYLALHRFIAAIFGRIGQNQRVIGVKIWKSIFRVWRVARRDNVLFIGKPAHPAPAPSLRRFHSEASHLALLSMMRLAAS